MEKKQDIKQKQLNGICPACKRYQEGECLGTTNPIWTGCIYRKIKK